MMRWELGMECYCENTNSIPITFIPIFILFSFWATFLFPFLQESHGNPLIHIPMHTSIVQQLTVFQPCVVRLQYLSLLWPPYVIGQAVIFLSCGFYLLSSSSFFPRLISAAADWMFIILPHMV